MSTTTVITFPPGRSSLSHPAARSLDARVLRCYLTELPRVPGLFSARVLIRRAIVAGCALVALGAACSSWGGSSAGSSTTARATTAPRPHPTTPTTAKRTTPTTPPALTLGALMLGDIPGYTRQSDDLADTGPTDLAKATLDDVGCNLGCDHCTITARVVRLNSRSWDGVASGAGGDERQRCE